MYVICNFQQFETVRFFGDSIYTSNINIGIEEDQNNLLDNIVEFNNKSRPKTKDSVNALNKD